MEQRGIPSMLVVTQPFAPMAEFESSSLGMPDLEVAIIEHPLVTMTRKDMESQIDMVLSQIHAFFGVGPKPPADIQ